ncbi:Uncharacterized protein APZ42_024448 [Daphnia magna]|uniref:Uncharacterized protein n=1 Tax=Daphnia magna TaxID=35525 RepID=A0A164U1A4_9CRUS|nr:Uncharacterized protein APZ42_024448 [Daphnia magna]
MKEVQNTHSKLLLCRPFVCVCSYFNYFLVFIIFFFFFFRCLEYFSRVRIVHPLLVWGLLQLYNNGSYFYRLLPLSPGVLPVWSFFLFFSFLFTVAQFSHCFSFFFISTLLGFRLLLRGIFISGGGGWLRYPQILFLSTLDMNGKMRQGNQKLLSDTRKTYLE